jgi:hypothetical protein
MGGGGGGGGAEDSLSDSNSESDMLLIGYACFDVADDLDGFKMLRQTNVQYFYCGRQE